MKVRHIALVGGFAVMSALTADNAQAQSFWEQEQPGYAEACARPGANLHYTWASTPQHYCPGYGSGGGYGNGYGRVPNQVTGYAYHVEGSWRQDWQVQVPPQRCDVWRYPDGHLETTCQPL